MPIKLFFSYSHRDENHRARLNLHLATLQRQGSIVEWHDRKIIAGQDWAALIDQNLVAADIILLLVSANFVASDYCYGNELKLALDRERRKEAVVIPIILSPVDWTGAPFGHLQAIPKDAKPITKWANRDEAWMNAAQGIRAAVEALESKRPRAESAPIATEVKAPAKPGTAPPVDGLQTLSLATTFLDNPQPLGASAMSKLYQGIHRQHGKVLLKILTGLTADSERWIASPAYPIALGERLIETGTSENGLRFVMLRYVEGVCLGEIVKPGNTIRGALLDDLVMQVLRQLAALNAANEKAVHRDVTPHNLILALEGGSPVVRLIDYESGCFAGDAQSAVSAFGFSPPEQSAGQAVPASDLFSLASSAYFLATGQVPASLQTPKQAFPHDSFGAYTELEELYGTTNFLQCWDAAVEKRPASAAEFLKQQEVPSTRALKAPRRLGEFVCGPGMTLELFDRCYSVMK